MLNGASFPPLLPRPARAGQQPGLTPQGVAAGFAKAGHQLSRRLDAEQAARSFELAGGHFGGRQPALLAPHLPGAAPLGFRGIGGQVGKGRLPSLTRRNGWLARLQGPPFDLDRKPEELPFRGVLDFETGPALGRAIKEYAPHVVATWMSRASAVCPKGHFVHVARLGGYYDLRYYKSCDHLIGNTRAIVGYAVAKGWPRERITYLPNFVPDARATAPPIAADAGVPNERAQLALALGRLHRNKGFGLLLEAIAEKSDVTTGQRRCRR